MKAFLTTLFVLVSAIAICQSKNVYEVKSFTGTYVADILINKVVYTDDCSCQEKIKKADRITCKLYEGKILKIRLMPNAVTAFDSISINKVKFFVAKADLALAEGKNYIVTLNPATSEASLLITKILDVDGDTKFSYEGFPTDTKDVGIVDHTAGGYLSGFSACYNISWFNRLLLKYNLVSRDKIYTKENRRTDKFDTFIANRK